VANADEGEPGTFKDRYLMAHDPHALIEGLMIAAYASRARHAYIYIRGEYAEQIAVVEEAVREAYGAGLLGKPVFGTDFSLEVTVYTGAGAYICGEETALLTSLEGQRGEPRLRPPYPVVKGLYGRSTVVHNVETLCNLAPILLKGGRWFAGLGTEHSGGTRLVTVSGHVKQRGVYEVPMTMTYHQILYDLCGGPARGMPIKAIFPGGTSTPIMTPDQFQTPICFYEMWRKGMQAGSGAIIVMDAGVCMVRSLANTLYFYAHESCGQCTPCREGTRWLTLLVDKIGSGKARREDIDTLYDVAQNMRGVAICSFADGAATPTLSILEKFRHEFDAHIGGGGCPMRDKYKELAKGWPYPVQISPAGYNPEPPGE